MRALMCSLNPSGKPGWLTPHIVIRCPISYQNKSTLASRCLLRQFPKLRKVCQWSGAHPFHCPFVASCSNSAFCTRRVSVLAMVTASRNSCRHKSAPTRKTRQASQRCPYLMMITHFKELVLLASPQKARMIFVPLFFFFHPCPLAKKPRAVICWHPVTPTIVAHVLRVQSHLHYAGKQGAAICGGHLPLRCLSCPQCTRRMRRAPSASDAQQLFASFAINCSSSCWCSSSTRCWDPITGLLAVQLLSRY